MLIRWVGGPGGRCRWRPARRRLHMSPIAGTLSLVGQSCYLMTTAAQSNTHAAYLAVTGRLELPTDPYRPLAD